MAKRMEKPTKVALGALVLPCLYGLLGPPALLGGWLLGWFVRRGRFGQPGKTAQWLASGAQFVCLLGAVACALGVATFVWGRGEPAVLASPANPERARLSYSVLLGPFRLREWSGVVQTQSRRPDAPPALFHPHWEGLDIGGLTWQASPQMGGDLAGLRADVKVNAQLDLGPVTLTRHMPALRWRGPGRRRHAAARLTAHGPWTVMD